MVNASSSRGPAVHRAQAFRRTASLLLATAAAWLGLASPSTAYSAAWARKRASLKQTSKGPHELKMLVTPNIARSFGGMRHMQETLVQAGVSAKFASMSHWYPAGVTGKQPKKVLLMSGEETGIIAAMRQFWQTWGEFMQQCDQPPDAEGSWTFLVPLQHRIVPNDDESSQESPQARLLVHVLPYASEKQVTISGNPAAMETSVKWLLSR
jgi:hypothetical protein